MNILTKWKIKYKIYVPLKSEIQRFNLKEESKYRLCLYKLLIYKLIIYRDYCYKYLLKKKYFIFKDNYIIWKNSIILLNLIKKYLNIFRPCSKVSKKNFQNINEKSFIIEIYNLYYLNNIKNIIINKKIFDINYIFNITKLIDLLLWIHYVNINFDLLNGKIFKIFQNIKLHQENCKKIKYYYNNILFDKNLSQIFNDIKYILLNYKFII